MLDGKPALFEDYLLNYFVIHRIKRQKRNMIDCSNPLEIHRSLNDIHASFAFCSF